MGAVQVSRVRRVVASGALALASVGVVPLAVTVAASPASATTCTDTWQGPTTGTTNWNASSSNWSSGFPTSSSAVCINAAGTYSVDLTASVSISSLQVGGGSSGTQTLLVDGSSTSVQFGLSAASTVANRGVLTLAPNTNGFAMITGSTVTVNSGGHFTTTGANQTAYIRSGLTNNGTVTIGAASSLQDSNTATANNNNFTVASAGNLSVTSGSDTFTNAGTLTVNGAFTETTGTFTQTSGSIAGSNPVVLTGGALTDTAGTGAFDVKGSITLSGSVPTGQTLTVDGSNTSVAVNVTSTTLPVDGTLALAPNTNGYALVENNTIVVDSGGTFTTTGANQTAYIRSNLTNNGTVTIGTADTRMDSNTTTTNNSNFTLSGGSGLTVSTGSDAFTNAGTLTVNGAFTESNGTFTQTSGSVAGSNPVVLTGGALSDTAGTGALDVRGSISLGGTVPTGQTVTVDGSNTSVTVSVTSTTLPVDGTLSLAPNTNGFAMIQNGTIVVDAGGTFTTTGANQIAYLRSNLTNNGTVTIGAAETRMDNNTTTTNNSTFTLSSGGGLTMTTGSDAFTNAGTLTVNGAFTQSTGTFTQTSGSITGSNPVVLTGGALADTAGTGAFDVKGSISLSGTVPTGQTVTIDGSNTSVEVNVTSTTLTVDGTLTLAPNTNGYALVQGNPITVAAGGVLSTAGASQIAYVRVNVTNQGTVNIGAADTRMDSNTTTSNSGTLQVQDGGHLTMTGTSTITDTSTGTLGTTIDATGPVTSGISGGSVVAGGTFQIVTVGSPTVGSTFTPISSSLTGSFSGLQYFAHGYSTNVSASGVSVTVTNLPFSVTAKAFHPVVNEPTTYTVASITTNLGTPTYSATINWGDSSTTNGTVSSGKVKGKHGYTSTGSFSVTVTVHASDGTTLSATKMTTVAPDPVPTVTGVSPSPVAAGSTYTLTITGTGMTTNAVAGFSASGVTVLSTTYKSPTTVQVKIKLAKTATLGAGNVTITTPGGTGTCTGCLTVDAAPKINTITPVPAAGATTTLTFGGSGFQSGLALSTTITGATFGSVTNQTGTGFQVQITIPGTTSSGTYSVTVTNPDGGKATHSITVS